MRGVGKKFPKDKQTGIYMDKNGLWKINLNIPIVMNVEESEGNWVEIRRIFITL
jgi:hypothetical protein